MDISKLASALALCVFVGGCGSEESTDGDVKSAAESPPPVAEERTFAARHIQASMLYSIAPVYGRLIEKNVVIDPDITGAVTMTVNTDQLMTRAEAIRFYEDTFLMNGFAVLSVDEQTSKLIDVSPSPPKEYHEGVYREGDEIPEVDARLKYMMTFEHLAADEAGRVFRLYTGSSPKRYGSSLDGSVLLLAESGRVLNSLIRLKELIDVSPPLESYPEEFEGLVKSD